MPNAPDLIIPIRFNYQGAANDLRNLSSQSQQAAQKAANAQVASQQAADQKRLQSVKATTAAIKQQGIQALTDEEVAEKAKIEFIRRSNEQRIQEVAKAQKTEIELAQEAQAEQERLAKQAAARHKAAMKAWEQEQEKIRQAKDEAARFTNELATIQKAQMVFAGMEKILHAVTEELNRAANHSREVAKEFIEMRRTMQEVATLSGKGNENEVTLEEARKAKAAHLTPQEYRDFQAEFLNYAGSQVGGPNGKLTEAQGQDYAARVAELMKGSGINPRIGAELAGSLLEQSEGPQDVNKLMGRLSKTFTVLEKGRVPLSKALPELSQIMSMGVSAEDAAKMYSIVSPAAAGQEGTSVQAALRAVQEMKNKGTGKEFGVEAGMGAYESVKAFSANITQRKQQLMAGGMTDLQAEDEIQKLLAEKQVAADSREARGLVRGFGRMGMQLGGFKRFEDIEAGTSATFEADRKKRYEESAGGKQALRDADAALARLESGAKKAGMEEMYQEAETQLEREGRFDKATLGDMGRKVRANFSGVDVRQQLINERAVRNAQLANGYDANAPADVRARTMIPAAEGGGVSGAESQQVVNEALVKLVERHNRMLDEQAKNQPALAAPPPMPGGGRRN